MSQGERRVWRLLRNPEGTDFEAAFSLENETLRPLEPGDVLIRAEYLSLDAGTRMWMSARTDGYQPPLPLGVVMPGLVLGRVTDSRDPKFQPGDLVRGFGQWSDWSIVTPAHSDLRRLNDTIPDVRQHLGVLGMNGWTAYVGLVETGRARPGETVLVSAAAGATGLLAAQIAKIMGCKVIGIAGGAEKCGVLTDAFWLDAAIDYKAENVEAALQKLGPIDVYFDNVGGPLLDAVLPNMAHYGRVAICGLIADYENGASGPKRFDQILMRRLSVTGFFSPDFAQRGDSINALIKPWLLDGRISLPFAQSDGLETVLEAYRGLFTGANIGKTVVKIR